LNKERRKVLQDIADKAIDLAGELECVRDEECEYRDNIPENLQTSERYEKAESAIYSIEEAIEELTRASDNILEAIEQ